MFVTAWFPVDLYLVVMPFSSSDPLEAFPTANYL